MYNNQNVHLTAPNIEARVRRVVMAMATLGREIDMILGKYGKYQKNNIELKSKKPFVNSTIR